jgi:hypothetical protein
MTIAYMRARSNESVLEAPLSCRHAARIEDFVGELSIERE